MGVLPMARVSISRENPCMQDATNAGKQDAVQKPELEIERLEQEIDERDETIRLLNEALSDALEQIERMAPRIAA